MTIASRPRQAILFLAGMLAAPAAAQSPAATDDAASQSYPMDRTHWTTQRAIGWAGRVAGAAAFARDEGIPTGVMKLNEGVAVLADAAFAQGQIDLDIKPIGYSDAGVLFHAHGTDDGEFIYVRANPDCPAAQDCVQYAPVAHGLMGWNIYPNYQASAPVNPAGWNHLTIRVASERMQLFVNHVAEPVLDVPRLLGLPRDGGIALKGPAFYANLVVRAGAPAMAAMPAIASPRGVVTNWVAASPTQLPRSRPVFAADIPGEGAWRPIAAQATGLVDLGRAFGIPAASAISTGWLGTVIDSPAPRRVLLHLGFATQAAVFVDGHAVYRGNNPYYPEEARLSPGGRIGFDNAAIPLELKRGRTQIVLAIGNDWRTDLPEPHPSHYGWAAEMRVDDR